MLKDDGDDGDDDDDDEDVDDDDDEDDDDDDDDDVVVRIYLATKKTFANISGRKHRHKSRCLRTPPFLSVSRESCEM